MAVFELPAAADGFANHDFRVELGGFEYTFQMRFNDRDQGWYLSILDPNLDPVLMGQRVIINDDLTIRATTDNAFDGRLYAIDARLPEAVPGFDELGTVVPLVYDDGAEV